MTRHLDKLCPHRRCFKFLEGAKHIRAETAARTCKLEQKHFPGESGIFRLRIFRNLRHCTGCNYCHRLGTFSLILGIETVRTFCIRRECKPGRSAILHIHGRLVRDINPIVLYSERDSIETVRLDHRLVRDEPEISRHCLFPILAAGYQPAHRQYGEGGHLHKP